MLAQDYAISSKVKAGLRDKLKVVVSMMALVIPDWLWQIN